MAENDVRSESLEEFDASIEFDENSDKSIESQDSKEDSNEDSLEKDSRHSRASVLQSLVRRWQEAGKGAGQGTGQEAGQVWGWLTPGLALELPGGERHAYSDLLHPPTSTRCHHPTQQEQEVGAGQGAG